MAKSVRGREEVRGDQNDGFTLSSSDPDVGHSPGDLGSQNGGGDPSLSVDNQETTVATKGRTELEKSAAFSRLASIRASNALDAMRGISHLANAKQYAFTREQIDKMLGALQDSVDALRKGFSVALEQAEATPSSDGTTGRKKRTQRQNFSIRV